MSMVFSPKVDKALAQQMCGVQYPGEEYAQQRSANLETWWKCGGYAYMRRWIGYKHGDTLDDSQLEEILQDMMVKVWRYVKQGRYKYINYRFSSFLKVIANRDSMKRAARLKQHTSFNDLEGTPGEPSAPVEALEIQLEAMEEEIEVSIHFQQLSPEDQEIITRRLLNEEEYEDIARALGKTQEAVRRSYSRAMKRWESRGQIWRSLQGLTKTADRLAG